jgi:hypothetical protein
VLPPLGLEAFGAVPALEPPEGGVTVGTAGTLGTSGTSGTSGAGSGADGRSGTSGSGGGAGSGGGVTVGTGSGSGRSGSCAAADAAVHAATAAVRQATAVQQRNDRQGNGAPLSSQCLPDDPAAETPPLVQAAATGRAVTAALTLVYGGQ